MKPRLMDVNCTPMEFPAGSRLLVQSRVPVDSSQRKQIHKMVQKWAGDHVEVLVIGPELEFKLERNIPNDIQGAGK